MSDDDRYGHINFVPPSNVAQEDARGLEYRKRAGGKGGLSTSQAKSEGIGSGVQRAVNLKNRDELDPGTVRRMKAFFDRHHKNKSVGSGKEPWEDRGNVAWLLWGGDPGYAWARKVVSQMDAVDKKGSIRKNGAAIRVVQAYLKQAGSAEDRIAEFLKENPKPSDDQIHSLAADLGIDKHQFEEKIYAMLGERLSKEASDLPSDQLVKGRKVEKEHGDAYDYMEKFLKEKGLKMPLSEDDFYEMIAKAHIREISDYYDRLEKMEGGAHKSAMDFTSIMPILTVEHKLEPREIARALRMAISAEHDAVHLYELMADRTEGQIKETLQDIANEEKVHTGELHTLLNIVDEETQKFEDEGREEAKEKPGEDKG